MSTGHSFIQELQIGALSQAGTLPDGNFARAHAIKPEQGYRKQNNNKGDFQKDCSNQKNNVYQPNFNALKPACRFNF